MDMKEYNRQRNAQRQAWFDQARETGKVVVGEGSGGRSSSGFCRSWDVYFPNGEWRVIHAHGPAEFLLDLTFRFWVFQTEEADVIEEIKLHEQRCSEEFQKNLAKLVAQQ